MKEDAMQWMPPSRKRKRDRDVSPSPSVISVPEKKFQLFQAISDKDKRKWDLPDELADYYNTNSRKFIPNKDVSESITD